MQSESDMMGETLSRPDSDWKKREECLKRVGTQLSAGSPEAVEMLNKYPQCMALQLSDLRSALVKLASEALLAFANSRTKLKVSPEKFIEGFLRDPNLYKALASANKVIAIHSTAGFQAIFDAGLVGFGQLEPLITQAKATKSGQLKEKITNALNGLVLASRAKPPKGAVLKPEQIEWIKRNTEFLLGDAVGEVRAAARNLHQSLSEGEKLVAKKSGESLAEFWGVARGSAVITKEKIENLKSMDKLKIANKLTVDEYRELLNIYDGLKNLELRKAVADVLEKTDLQTFGDSILEFLIGAGSNCRRRIPFIDTNILRSFSLEQLINCFLSSNNQQSLTIVAKKLKLDEFSELLSYAKTKHIAVALITILSKNTLRMILPQDYRTQCFQLLQTLVALPPVRRELKELDCFRELVEVFEKNGDTTLSKDKPQNGRFDSPKPQGLKKNGEQTSKSKFQTLSNSKENAQQKQNYLQQVDEIIEQVKYCKPTEEQLNASARKCISLWLKEVQSSADARIFNQVFELSQLVPRDSKLIPPMQEIVFEAFGRDVAMREPAARTAVKMPQLYRFACSLLEKMENVILDKSVISNSLKFFTRLFKYVREDDPDNLEFEEVIKNNLTQLTNVLRSTLLNHYEISVRKNSVQLVVEAHHFLHPELFSFMLSQFSVEHQRLIKQYIQKSLNQI